MPETRKIEHFAASDKPTPQKIGETFYEVSDEQIEAEIEAEAREVAIQKIAENEKAAIRAKREMAS